MVQHKDLVDAERHEPKGAAAAAINTVYISNGAGSGSFGLVDAPTVVIEQASDFPTAVSGVRTLAVNTTYTIVGAVDILTDRLVVPTTAVLKGSILRGGKLISSVASNAMITSTGTLVMRDLTLEATGTGAQAISASGNAATDLAVLQNTEFTNCTKMGTFSNFAQFFADGLLTTNCADGFLFSNSFGGITFNNASFNSGTAGTYIKIDSSVTIVNRIRVSLSLLSTPAGVTAIDADAGATVPVESYDVALCQFKGAGTFIAGVQAGDNKALFLGNSGGVPDSVAKGSYSIDGNATATTITTQSVPVKLAGTTIDGDSDKFTLSDNKAVYDGDPGRTFLVVAGVTFTSTNNQQCRLFVAKNGTVVSSSKQQATTDSTGTSENLQVNTVLTLVTTDFIELFMSNETSTSDITWTDGNMSIIGI